MKQDQRFLAHSDTTRDECYRIETTMPIDW